jgi:hypothetical protein
VAPAISNWRCIRQLLRGGWIVPRRAAISQVRSVALQVISLVEIVNDTRQNSDLVLVRSPASG